MTPETKTLLERIDACVNRIRNSTKGRWIIPKMADGTMLWVGPLLENTKGCLHGGTRIIECNAFDLDEKELRELKRNLKSIVTAHNTAPPLLTESADIIRNLLAEIETLKAREKE